MWSLIYVLLLIFVISAYVAEKNDPENVDIKTYSGYANRITNALEYILIINLSLNMLWVMIYTLYGHTLYGLLLSFLVISGILATTIIMYVHVYHKLGNNQNANFYIPMYSWLPIMFGWLILATLASISQISKVLYNNDMYEPLLVITFVAVGLLFGLTGDPGTLIPFIIGSLGIYAKNMDGLSLALLIKSVSLFIGSFYYNGIGKTE
jgi:hypothetical protein